MAARAGVRALAITDHDTLDALPRAEAEATLRGLTLIPGVELSVEVDGQDLHILAYFLDPASAELRALLTGLRAAREARLTEILGRLAELGVELDEAAVRAKVGPGGNIGRNHIAEALVARGAVADNDEAFRRYLRDGGPACVAKKTASLEESIRVLLEAGAVPALAHPATYRLEPVFWRLTRSGLLGLEVSHPSHSPTDVQRFREMARSWGLCETGGSDYHGNRMGEATPGALPLGVEILVDLNRAREQVRDRLAKLHAKT